jgi:hypothetical protein
MSSRLSRSIERSKLSGGPPRLGGQALPLRTPNVQPRPRETQIGIEALVPMLLAQGLRPQYRLGRSPDGKIGVLGMELGPITIPFAFDAALGRKLVDDLVAKIEQITLAEAAIPVPAASPELEQLLAESQARTGGPVAADPAEDLTWEINTRMVHPFAMPCDRKPLAEVVADAAAEAAPALHAVREAREAYDAQFLPFRPAEACTDDDGGPELA